MTLGGTDLNLLLFLRVLLEEGNVTRAGHRLQVGQPAMSATPLSELSINPSRKGYNHEEDPEP